jgi:putative transposase
MSPSPAPYLTVCRYVEANPLRSGLVKRARDWQWSSLWAHLHKTATPRPDAWPLRRPAGWETLAQAAMDKGDLEQLRTSVRRGRPFGSEPWVLKTARQLGLGFTLRDRGRPKKSKK